MQIVTILKNDLQKCLRTLRGLSVGNHLTVSRKIHVKCFCENEARRIGRLKLF